MTPRKKLRRGKALCWNCMGKACRQLLTGIDGKHWGFTCMEDRCYFGALGMGKAVVPTNGGAIAYH